jgi:hypothetical protein
LVMDETTAKAVIGVGFGVGVLVWMWAMRLYGKMVAEPREQSSTIQIQDHPPDEALKLVVATSNQAAMLERPDPNTLLTTFMGMDVRFLAAPQGVGTVLTTEIDATRFTRITTGIMGVLLFVLAPLVLVGVAAVLWNNVAPNPNPAVRWQALQIMQIIHILWPPFLVYFIHKRTLSMVKSAITRLQLMIESG